MKNKYTLLDMGSGVHPHPKATHAVDRSSNIKHLTPPEIKEYREDAKRNLELKLKQMDYRLNFNYNTQKLPWPNNSFNMVYSNGSIGTYGKRAAYKEAFRVLKHGGILKFGAVASTSIEGIKKVGQMLKDIGFINVRGTEPFGTKDIGFSSYTHNKRKLYSIWIQATKP